jgi:hypothetical protein
VRAGKITSRGEYVDDAGHHFARRAANEKGYAESFADNPNATIQIAIDSVNMLNSTTAMEDGPSGPGAGGIGRPGVGAGGVGQPGVGL